MQKREKLLLLIVIIFIALLFILALTIFYPRVGTGEEIADTSPLIFSNLEDAPDTLIEYIREEPENERTVKTMTQEGEEPILIIEQEVPEDGLLAEAPTVVQLKDDQDPETAHVAEEKAGADISSMGLQEQSSDTNKKTTEKTPRKTTATTKSSTSTVKTKPSTQSSFKQADTTVKHMYWVQLASSPNYFTVMYIQEFLSGYGIGTIIVPKQISSVLYMRVRVGPYYNRQEAEKFAFWFRNVKGLQSSYVSREKN